MKTTRFDLISICLASALAWAIPLTSAAAQLPDTQSDPGEEASLFGDTDPAFGEAAFGKSAFGEAVDVQLVNVEVWVTDKQGQPITGLTAADFQIREDRQSVEISHFTEVRDPAMAAALEPTNAKAGETSTNMADEPLAEPFDPGYLVLYFDETHMTLASRKRAVKSLRVFLEDALVPAERIMILRQGHVVTSAVSFESTGEELRAALDGIAKAPTPGAMQKLEKALELRQLETSWEASELQQDPCRGFLSQAHAQIQIYAHQRRVRARATASHLQAVTSFLAGLPGLKTLLFISDAMEVSPGDDLLIFVNHVCPIQDQDDYRLTVGDDVIASIDKLARHASANRVAIYPWQAMGLVARPFGQLDNTKPVPMLESRMRSNDRDGLSFLAQKTGGKLLANRNKFRNALADVARDMTTHYSLAYVPLHGGDGDTHKIDVDVRAEGRKVRVRHRREYLDKSSDERMNESLQSALYLGVNSNPLAARVGVGTVKMREDGGFTLPLHVMVPPSELVFLPQADSEVAEIQVKVATRRSTDGKVSFVERAIRAPKPALESDLLDIPFPIDVAKGVHVLAVGLRDRVSLETSYLATAVEIVEPSSP